MPIQAFKQEMYATPLERYRWRKGMRVSELSSSLGWSLYKTRSVLRGVRRVKPEEISHMSLRTEGEVDAVHWAEWFSLRESNPDFVVPRLTRMKTAGDSRDKSCPVSVVLYQEHIEHLRGLASREGASFSSVLRKIVDSYFNVSPDDDSKHLAFDESEEQFSSCDEVEAVSPLYDDNLIQQLVMEQGETLNFDEDDVRRFLAAKSEQEGEG